MFGVFIASLGAALVVEAGFLAWTKGVVSVARTGMLDNFSRIQGHDVLSPDHLQRRIKVFESGAGASLL